MTTLSQKQIQLGNAYYRHCEILIAQRPNIKEQCRQTLLRNRYNTLDRRNQKLSITESINPSTCSKCNASRLGFQGPTYFNVSRYFKIIVVSQCGDSKYSPTFIVLSEDSFLSQNDVTFQKVPMSKQKDIEQCLPFYNSEKEMVCSSFSFKSHLRELLLVLISSGEF